MKYCKKSFEIISCKFCGSIFHELVMKILCDISNFDVLCMQAHMNVVWFYVNSHEKCTFH